MADTDTSGDRADLLERAQLLQQAKVIQLSKAGQDEDGPSWSSIGKKFIDTALPAAGAVGAGLLATPESMGAATIPAGAMGYTAGKQLARILDSHIFGEGGGESSLSGQVKQTAGDLLEGGSFEMGGRILGEVPGLLKSGTDSALSSVRAKFGPSLDYSPISNQADVIKSGGELGVEIPRGVLTDNPNFQKLESGLSQSGSLPAKGVRDQYNNFFKGIDQASDKIADLKTPQSDFSLGASIKDDLAKQVNNARAPVSEMYNNLTPDLQKIPVDAGVVNQTFGTLKRNPIFQTKDGMEALEDAKNVALQQPELNSLKEWRSTVRDSVGSTSAPIDEKRAEAIQNAATTIRDNSINVMKENLPQRLHPEVDNLIDEIATADSAHAGNLKDLNSIKSIVGPKDINSPVTFLNKLSDMKEEDIARRAANLDVTSMQNLKNKFPTVFDKAQAAKINDMVQNSMSPTSGFNVNRFMKQYGDMGQEAKDLIFTPELQSHIENLKTIKQAIPEKLGPSGTPEGLMTMNMLDPKRNALDYGIKKVLDYASGAKPQEFTPSDTAVQTSKVANILEMIPKSKQASVMFSPAAAANNKPTKGPEKWANDGFDKLLQHVDDPDEIKKLNDMKAKLFSDPRAKEKLADASGLKPGSKAMDKILKDIQDKYGGDK